MPTYEYACDCGLQFEKTVKMSSRASKQECPACGGFGEPMVPSQVQGHFRKEVSGPVPQNTGIHDLDTHIDRVIGQSAKQGYDVIHRRHQDKLGVLANNPGATGHDLSRGVDGSYRVMKPEERAIHDRSQKNHSTAMDVISRTWKPSRRSSPR